MSWARFSRRARLSGAYRETFATPAGEKVLADVLKRAGLLENGFEPDDPHGSAYNLGRRSVALEIVDLLRWREAEVMELARRRAQEEIGFRSNNDDTE